MSEDEDKVYSEQGVFRVCSRCGHPECPFCRDGCDRCTDGDSEAAEDHHPDCARDGECVYDRAPDPRLDTFLNRAAKAFGPAFSVGVEGDRLWARK